MNTKLTGYAAIIAEAIGTQDAEILEQVEDCMRHTIFHSTLDWQSKEELMQAAREAVQVLNASRELNFTITTVVIVAPEPEAYQDVRHDPAYPVISFTHEGSYAIYTPTVEDGDNIGVRILADDTDEQEALEEAHSGDYMTGTPSIALDIPIGDERTITRNLTWAEAYNLGRALIDKANEAHYG